MGLGGHLSQQDIELIEAGVHPVIDSNYSTKEKKKKKPNMGRVPIPRTGGPMKDKSDYTRKVKHKKKIDSDKE